MPCIVGFDTETVEGPPELVQFYSEDQGNLTGHIWVNGETVTQKVLEYFEARMMGSYVIFAHNLAFDLVSIFYPMYSLLVQKRTGEFSFHHDGWDISGVMVSPSPCFCTLSKGDIEVRILDSYSWFQTSLDKAGELVCPHIRKLEHPEGLGTVYHTPKDKDFIAYAMRDAEVSYHLGKAIDDMHHEFNLEQCWSVANMAQRIFCQHFIDEPIYNVGSRVTADAYKAYHGGKNLVLPDSFPSWHYPVDGWDISSAYPHAMTLLPAFSDPKLFRCSEVFSASQDSYPDFGVYCIQGETKQCDWPILYTSNLADPQTSFKPIQGKIPPNTWVTGWELNEALRAGEVKLSKIFGHYYQADKDPVKETALQRYVHYFYKMKSEATDKMRRTMYKMLLNSLSGKFIQKMNVEDDDGFTGVKAGPLWHPFMAALINGHTRAVMHQLEHATQALHTSTDGILCLAKNSPKSFPFAPAEGLGSIEREIQDCHLALFRNKRYVLYTDQPTNWESPHRKDSHRYVAKFACHGSPASLEQLERAALFGEREFLVEKPNKPRESLRRGLVPNLFQKHRVRLKDGPLTGNSKLKGK